MTAEILYTGKLPREELPAFIKECGFRTETATGKFTYLLAESQPEHVVEQKHRQSLLAFDTFKLDSPFEGYKKYTSGRIFSEDGELRWERQNEQVRIIYLGNPTFASVKRALEIYNAQFKNKKTALEQLEPRKPTSFYYLFGTKLEKRTIEQINGDQLNNVVKVGDFAELRIHRVLDYPAPGHIPDKGYVQLQVQEYVERDSGRVQLFRFQALVPEQDPRKERAG